MQRFLALATADGEAREALLQRLREDSEPRLVLLRTPRLPHLILPRIPSLQAYGEEPGNGVGKREN